MKHYYEIFFNFSSPDVFHNYHKIYTFVQHIYNPFKKYPHATCFGPLGPSSGLTKCTKIKGTCSFVRPDDGPRGPKHVACRYSAKGCRCVERMHIFYDNYYKNQLKSQHYNVYKCFYCLQAETVQAKS
jgi:hypothetical protein